MKKLLMIAMLASFTLSCSSDDSSTVPSSDNSGQAYIPDNIMYIYSEENSIHGWWTMYHNGEEIDGYLHRTTVAYTKIINADLLTSLEIQALNDCPLSIKLNRSNVDYEGELEAGRHYEVQLGTDEDGHKIVEDIIAL